MLDSRLIHSFLLFVLIIEQIDCLDSTFQLDEETPSFAIHGIDLDRLGSITIYGLHGSDFLIDLTHRGCKNIPDHLSRLSKNRFSSDHSQLVPCLDPYPLSINERIPEKDTCKEVIPYDMSFEQLFYLCSFKVVNTSKLIVKSLKEAITLDYAISFRVSDWVYASSRIFVIPTDGMVDSEEMAALIRPNTIAVFVCNPNVYRSSLNGSGFFLQLVVGGQPNACGLLIEEEVTCPMTSNYSVYVGADPGKAKSPKYHYFDRKFRLNQLFDDFRESVLSVLAGDHDCSFCIGFSLSAGNEQLLYEGSQMLSSYNYLWQFGDPRIVDVCQTIFMYPFVFASGQWDFEIEFISLQAVRLNLTGYLDLLGTFFCALPKTVYQKSFVDSPKDPQLIQGRCLRFDWCPTADVGDKFGFELRVTIKKPEVQRKDCHDTFELTKQDPHYVLNLLDAFLQNLMSTTTLICVFQDCPSDRNCPLLVDFSFSCPTIVGVSCEDMSEWELLEINNAIPDMNDCTFWDSSRGLQLIVQCQLIFNGHVYFRGFVGALYILFSAISVRSLEWTRADEWHFFLVPSIPPEDEEAPTDLALIFSPQPISSWVSLSFRMDSMPRISKFRSSHGIDGCEYRMIDGPPDPDHLHPDRSIFTFRDSDRFISQSLESELYSIHIPPGCSPSIVLQALDVDLESYFYEEEICAGVAIIATHAYRNPFEYVTIEQGYHINRTISCSYFKINVTVEIVAFGEGQLEMEVDDSESKHRSVCPLEHDPPLNCTLFEISALRVIWIPKTQKIGDGCLIRVHVSKSSIPFDRGAQLTTTEMISTTNHRESCRISAFLSFVIVLSLSSVLI